MIKDKKYTWLHAWKANYTRRTARPCENDRLLNVFFSLINDVKTIAAQIVDRQKKSSHAGGLKNFI